APEVEPGVAAEVLHVLGGMGVLVDDRARLRRLRLPRARGDTAAALSVLGEEEEQRLVAHQLLERERGHGDGARRAGHRMAEGITQPLAEQRRRRTQAAGGAPLLE